MHDDAASPWVRRFAPLVRARGRVLDVACGAGRHAAWFAARGCSVIAVDRDPACAAAIAARAPAAPIEFRLADLERDGWPFAPGEFDAIVCTRYLFRPILPALAASLADGGLLIYETFAVGQARYGRPTCADFLLRPGELLDAYATLLRIVAYEDGIVEAPRPARLQRVCAVREPRADGGDVELPAERLRLDAPEPVPPAQ